MEMDPKLTFNSVAAKGQSYADHFQAVAHHLNYKCGEDCRRILGCGRCCRTSCCIHGCRRRCYSCRCCWLLLPLQCLRLSLLMLLQRWKL